MIAVPATGDFRALYLPKGARPRALRVVAWLIANGNPNVPGTPYVLDERGRVVDAHTLPDFDSITRYDRPPPPCRRPHADDLIPPRGLLWHLRAWWRETA